MILVLPFHARDIHLAHRLLRWIGFLSERDGKSMRNEKVLLVPNYHCSQRITYWEMVNLARKIFGQAFFHVPPGEYERGYPGSANWMFTKALCFVEQHFKDDMFWLEPDAVPTAPEWYRVIKTDYESEGKCFLGNRVQYDPKYIHMTGIGVYGRHWRQYAPKLVSAPDWCSWDCWAGEQVLSACHVSELIQHEINPRIDLAFVNDNAVVFHKDKTHGLMKLLDDSKFEGNGAKHLEFSYEINDDDYRFMTKFYHADNATRTIKAQGFDFKFEVYDQFAGTWRGVFAAAKEGEIIAMDSLVKDPKNAVTEITKEEYESKTKKKWIPQHFNGSTPWRAPQASISPSPAVLVETPRFPLPSEPPKIEDQPVAEKIEDVLIIGTVQPAQPPPTTPELVKRKPGRPKRVAA